MDKLLAFALSEDTLKVEDQRGSKEGSKSPAKIEKKFERKQYTPEYDFKPKINQKSRIMVSRSRSRPKLFDKPNDILDIKETKSMRLFSREEAEKFYEKRKLRRSWAFA